MNDRSLRDEVIQQFDWKTEMNLSQHQQAPAEPGAEPGKPSVHIKAELLCAGLASELLVAVAATQANLTVVGEPLRLTLTVKQACDHDDLYRVFEESFLADGDILIALPKGWNCAQADACQKLVAMCRHPSGVWHTLGEIERDAAGAWTLRIPLLAMLIDPQSDFGCDPLTGEDLVTYADIVGTRTRHD